MTIDSTDGINGTDNVKALFPDRPTAAPIAPQPEVAQSLEEFLLDAANGKCVGVILIGFDSNGNHRTSMSGKVVFSYAVSALEQMKFGIQARDYAKYLQDQMGQ